MTRECFAKLCGQLERNIGLENFKSEHYLNEVPAGIITEKKTCQSSPKVNQWLISGEVNLAHTLRLLSGGLYMDLALLYKTGFTYS